MNRPDQRTRSDLSVVDLFSGCGGLSLGFAWAGFDVAAAIEHDPLAAATHHRNFDPAAWKIPGGIQDSCAQDVLTVDPEKLLEEKLGGRHPDVIVGGPPCQAFARVGRAKLRSIAQKNGAPGEEADTAHLLDERAGLGHRYLDFVEVLQPRALLMENVPDMASPGGGKHPVSELCERLESLGYTASFTLLNAAHQGVPQFRERLFILAFRGDDVPDGAREEWWPEPLCDVRIPAGYKGIRAVARGAALRLRDRRFVDRDANEDMPLFGRPSPRGTVPPTDARSALGDLPVIDPGALGHGPRAVSPSPEDPPYRCSTPSAYAQLMRELRPPGARGRTLAADRVSAHVTRYLPRDFRTFANMHPGQDYVGAVFGASDGGCAQVKSVREVALSIGAEPPPYPEHMFPNKWWKLCAELPVKTLTAHIGKDTYSHIHYEQGRTISVREAARLQSFPDSFRFEGGMNTAFRMIGNAVPPLMAYAIARRVRKKLTGRARPDLRKALAP